MALPDSKPEQAIPISPENRSQHKQEEIVYGAKTNPGRFVPLPFHPDVTFTPKESVLLAGLMLSIPYKEFNVRFGATRRPSDDEALEKIVKLPEIEEAINRPAEADMFIKKLSSYLSDPDMCFYFNPPDSPAIPALEVIEKIRSHENRRNFAKYALEYLIKQLLNKESKAS